MANKPLLIGVTGGIGAGKSIICKIFQSLNIPVYNADNRAKWLMVNDQLLINNIKNEFGAEAYMQDNSLNRVFLSKEVFANEERRQQLNDLVHPKVGEDFTIWIKKKHDYPYLIKEAALLFETGTYKELDKTINVDAPVSLRKTRVFSRDPHRKAEDIDAIMSSQFSDQQRKKMADHTIINDDRHLVIPQILSLHKKFLDISDWRTAKSI